MISEESQTKRALAYIKKMLSERGIDGTDNIIPSVHDCPGYITGMQRGEHFAVFVVKNINKAVVNAVFDYCNPPEAEAEDDDTDKHPHHGNDVRKAIIVYSDKCTTMAAKSIEGSETVVFERFKVEELLRIPLIFAFNTSCRLLDEDEVKRLTARTPLDKLPKMWTTDPIQRYYNAPVGSVYEIVEKFGVLQPEIKHRVVTAQSC